MKISLNPRRIRQQAYALLLVMAFIGAGLLTMGGMLSWSSNTSSNIERNNQYYRTMAAAEAATEKVLASIERDFHHSGQRLVNDNMDDYRSTVPLTSEQNIWNNYTFTDATGASNKVTINQIFSQIYTNLDSQYSGLRGTLNHYELISSAREINSKFRIPVGIREELQTCSIPLFQFAIFYGIDMELHPGQPMDVRGRVHSNSNLFNFPDGTTLTYWGDVTAVGDIQKAIKPGDPKTNRATGTVIYKLRHDSRVPTLNLPLRDDGVPVTPIDAHKIIELPDGGDPVALSRQKLYNKADLIIVVNNGSQSVRRSPTMRMGMPHGRIFPGARCRPF
jgi:hypothetical protein